jgi:pyridoxamine 5'-phosphate oxidase
VLHWDSLGRQLRLEGPAVRSPDADSDAYFARRPWRSQINAWASRQSAPLDNLADLEATAQEIAARFAAPDPFSDVEPEHELAVPRPSFWGGYRFWLEAVEFWVSGRDRFHERLRFERELERSETSGYMGGPWHAQQLQP